MELHGDFRPRLRPLEAFPLPSGNGRGLAVRDRTGLSEAIVTLSPSALHLLSLVDGVRTCDEIRGEFLRTTGQPVTVDTLGSVLRSLEQAHFLEGPAFERFYSSRLQEYRAIGIRQMRAAALGVGGGTASCFAEMLAESASPEVSDRVAGLVAPHLDYPRGRVCYADAYRSLRNRPAPERIVILGTNHFGRSTAVVGTANDFVTPLGRTQTDRDFLRRLSSRCGDLTRFELDHQREHSVELQLAWLQYLFGTGSFCIAAFLCPDPCGPTGTAPVDGAGPDLREFAVALRECVNQDGTDTLFVAGADLSHVGQAFGDDLPLDEGVLAAIQRHDENVLSTLTTCGAERFRQTLAAAGNPTRICSAGCMFALATVLEHCRPRLLRYHQAVDQPSQTCVTCAAIAYT